MSFFCSDSINFKSHFSPQLVLQRERPSNHKKDTIQKILDQVLEQDPSDTSPSKNCRHTILAKLEMHFEISSVNRRIESLKWVHLNRFSAFHDDFYLKVIQADSIKIKKSHYYQLTGDTLDPERIKNKFISCLSGNQIHARAKSMRRGFPGKKGEEYWARGSWRSQIFCHAKYRDMDQRILHLVEKILNQPLEVETVPRNQEGKLSILEFFGGKGDCGEQIMAHFSDQITYFFTEKDEEAVKLAQTTLGKKTPFLWEFDALESDLNIFKDHQPFSVVLASGGTTWEVLEKKEDAIKVLKRMFQIVAPGGILVLTGLQKQWVADDELENLLGGEMLNRYDPDLDREFYILQKKRGNS